MKQGLYAIALLFSCAAQAQSSANHQLESQAWNLGGHPADGIAMSSANYEISLDSIGDTIEAVSMTSASNRIDSNLVAVYAPAGEVAAVCGAGGPCLHVDRGAPATQAVLSWPVEPNAITYDLYRDDILALPGLGFGSCQETGISDPTTDDTTEPTADHGYFYLATAVNRVGEHGTKGAGSDLVERDGAICP